MIMLNTGWTGGPYGKGERMSLKDTRPAGRCAQRRIRRPISRPSRRSA